MASLLECGRLLLFADDGHGKTASSPDDKLGSDTDDTGSLGSCYGCFDAFLDTMDASLQSPLRMATASLDDALPAPRREPAAAAATTATATATTGRTREAAPIECGALTQPYALPPPPAACYVRVDALPEYSRLDHNDRGQRDRRRRHLRSLRGRAVGDAA